jgi:hypothetical protein
MQQSRILNDKLVDAKAVMKKDFALAHRAKW